MQATCDSDSGCSLDMRSRSSPMSFLRAGKALIHERGEHSTRRRPGQLEDHGFDRSWIAGNTDSVSTRGIHASSIETGARGIGAGAAESTVFAGKEQRLTIKIIRSIV